jgi:hypothetical protein
MRIQLRDRNAAHASSLSGAWFQRILADEGTVESAFASPIPSIATKGAL